MIAAIRRWYSRYRDCPRYPEGSGAVILTPTDSDGPPPTVLPPPATITPPSPTPSRPDPGVSERRPR